MKKIIFIIAFASLVLINCREGKAETESKAATVTSITDMLKLLMKSMPDKVVGWERITGKNETFSDLSKFTASLNNSSLLESCSKVIAEQTDYQCISGEDYFIIYPKVASLPQGGALVSRTVKTPAASATKSLDFLRKIEAVNPEDKIKLSPGIYSPNNAQGVIEMESGTGALYLVLNRMARQTKAAGWIMSDILIYSHKEGVPATPNRLEFGTVAFYIGVKNLPYYDSLRHHEIDLPALTKK